MNVIEGIKAYAKVHGPGILSQIKENRRKREGCQGPHIFEPIKDISGRQRCSECNCEESIVFVLGYQQGLEHGKANKE